MLHFHDRQGECRALRAQVLLLLLSLKSLQLGEPTILRQEYPARSVILIVWLRQVQSQLRDFEWDASETHHVALL